MNKQITSISTIAFQGYDIEVALREIAKIGIEYVEFAFIKGYTKELSEETFSLSYANILKQFLSNYDLKTHVLSAHMDLGEENSVQDFKKRLSFAKELGVRIVVSNSSTRKNRAAFFENIRKLSNYAEQLQLVIALENPGDGENNLIGSGEDGARVIKEIKSPYVQLNYDFGNAYSYSKGQALPEIDVYNALPHLAYYHFKDTKEDEQGWIFKEIGQGVINYEKIAQIIKQQPNQLPVGLELPMCVRRDKKFNPVIKSETPDLDEIVDFVKASFEYTTEILNPNRE